MQTDTNARMLTPGAGANGPVQGCNPPDSLPGQDLFGPELSPFFSVRRTDLDGRRVDLKLRRHGRPVSDGPCRAATPAELAELRAALHA